MITTKEIRQYRIPSAKFKDLKSRLFQESLSEFWRKDLVLWSVAALTGYIILRSDIFDYALFYVLFLVFILVNKVLMISSHSKWLIKSFLVKIYPGQLSAFRGIVEQKIELSDFRISHDRYHNLVIKSAGRNAMDKLIGLKQLKIPPEIDGFQEIEQVLLSKSSKVS